MSAPDATPAHSCEWEAEDSNHVQTSCGRLLTHDQATDDFYEWLTVCPVCKGRVIEVWVFGGDDDE